MLPERVFHDGYPADGNVEGLGHDTSAGVPYGGGCVICGGHEPVRLIPVPGRQDDLGVAAAQCQAGLAGVIVTPPQLVAEGSTVEAQARVKIWDRDGDRVDHLEQGSR